MFIRRSAFDCQFRFDNDLEMITANNYKLIIYRYLVLISFFFLANKEYYFFYPFYATLYNKVYTVLEDIPTHILTGHITLVDIYVLNTWAKEFKKWLNLSRLCINE